METKEKHIYTSVCGSCRSAKEKVSEKVITETMDQVPEDWDVLFVRYETIQRRNKSQTSAHDYRLWIPLCARCKPVETDAPDKTLEINRKWFTNMFKTGFFGRTKVNGTAAERARGSE